MFEVLANLGVVVMEALALIPGRRRFDFRQTISSEDAGGFAAGIERRKNLPYLEIRVKTALGTGREHYRLAPEEYGHILNDRSAGAAFAAECREGRHDDRLFRPRRRARRATAPSM